MFSVLFIKTLNNDDLKIERMRTLDCALVVQLYNNKMNIIYKKKKKKFVELYVLVVYMQEISYSI